MYLRICYYFHIDPIIRQINVSELRRWKDDVCCTIHNVVHLTPNPSVVEEALNGPNSDKWIEAIN